MEMRGGVAIYTLAEYVAWQNERLKRGPGATVCRIGPCTHRQDPDPEPEPDVRCEEKA